MLVSVLHGNKRNKSVVLIADRTISFDNVTLLFDVDTLGAVPVNASYIYIDQDHIVSITEQTTYTTEVEQVVCINVPLFVQSLFKVSNASLARYLALSSCCSGYLQTV